MEHKYKYAITGAYAGFTSMIALMGFEAFVNPEAVKYTIDAIPTFTLLGAWSGYTLGLGREMHDSINKWADKDRQKESPLAQISTNKPTDIQGPQY